MDGTLGENALNRAEEEVLELVRKHRSYAPASDTFFLSMGDRFVRLTPSNESLLRVLRHRSIDVSKEDMRFLLGDIHD